MVRKNTLIAGLGAMLGAALLSGCSTYQTTHADATGSAVSPAAFSAPAPQVNPEFASRISYNALADASSGTIRLGAGDRFGNQMHSHQIALVRARETNRLFAEVLEQHSTD